LVASWRTGATTPPNAIVAWDSDAVEETVTVYTADLHRLLLAFRDAIEHPPLRDSDQWRHMWDWDVRFEELADVVEKALGAPDDRIRCKPNYRRYEWGEFEDLVPVNVKNASLSGTPARLRHLAELGDGGPITYLALCGFHLVEDDIAKKPKADYPMCPVCSREARLRGVAPEPTQRRD
jgi:hypothetical protein